MDAHWPRGSGPQLRDLGPHYERFVMAMGLRQVPLGAEAKSASPVTPREPEATEYYGPKARVTVWMCLAPEGGTPDVATRTHWFVHVVLGCGDNGVLAA